jgi:tRNA/rRNA methyltransferase
LKNKQPVSDQTNELRVVLVSTRNPLNIGAAARALSNFGFSRLRLVNPYDPAFREARSAVGGASLLQSAEVFSSVAEAVADCSLVVGTTAARARELHQPLKRLEPGGREIRKRLATEQVALMFGSEKRGLLKDELSHCHWLLRIPTREGVSMNLGQAVAVCLYELIRDGKKVGSVKGATLAASGEVERINGVLVEALQVSGYVNPKTAISSEEKIRRLTRRLQIPAEDAEVWLGMLRQILWKLRK